MATWPALGELKQVLDVTSTDWDTTLERVLASAIREVKATVGEWDDDVDSPTDSLAAAALRMAELMAMRPDSAADTVNDPTYARHVAGSRRRFGIST